MGMFKDHFEEFPEFSEILGQGEEFYKEDQRTLSLMMTQDYLILTIPNQSYCL